MECNAARTQRFTFFFIFFLSLSLCSSWSQMNWGGKKAPLFDPFWWFPKLKHSFLKTIIVMYPVRAGISPECSKPAPKRGTESPLRSKSSTTSLVTAGKMNALPRWVHAGIHEWYWVACFWRSLIWTLLVIVSSIFFHCQSIHVFFLRAWTSDSQCRASFNRSLT